ncbi:MAG: YkgJ family cysteine cluster protein [Planctomycetes bacterium]|nr:YkgJ family cysteine cluster protein [Planctomycetota bacterium]
MSWYDPGLKFSCTNCGNCCTGSPGFTWVDDREIARLAERLGLDEAAFRRRYIREAWRGGEQRTSLVDKPNHDCVFYARGVGCTVYDDRPKQCRTWPFWKRVVETREDWLDAGRECPGIGRGRLHTAEEIRTTASDDGLP